MPDNVIPVNELDKMGLIADTPSTAIPPNSFSDCLNVRFRDGAVSKMQGEVNIFRDIFAETDVVKYVAWWPSPNLAQVNSGYYLVIVEREITDPDNASATIIRDQAFFIKPGATTLPSVAKGTFMPSGNWQHTFFQGGFALIINNGVSVPQYVLDPEGNQEELEIPDFAELPGWDSYNINEEILNSDFDSAVNSRIFDAGQLVNFAANMVIVEITSGDGSVTEFVGPTTSADGYAPDPLPDSVTTPVGDTYALYTDATTNTTVVVFGDGLITGVTARVLIRSINPIQVRAGVIRSFGDFLVAGNLTERDQTDLDIIVRSLPGVVRTSDVAAPGSIPNNWNPFGSGVSTADEFVITQDGIVQDLVELQSNLYIYSNSSISVMRLTGNAQVPLTVQPVTPSYGCLTTEGVLEFDGKHVVVGSQDIYLFGGHPGTIQSISDARVRDLFYKRLNPLLEDSIFMLRYQQKDEIWICYASVDSLGSARDEALIWNYRNNTWTRRSLPGVYSGDIGPVPGGGLPLATIDLDGTSGNNTERSALIQEQQEIPIGNVVIQDSGTGEKTEYDIHVNESLPEFTASGPALFDIALPTDFFSGSAGKEIHMTFEGFATPTSAGSALVFIFEVALVPELMGYVGVNGISTIDSIKASLTSNADFNEHFNFIDVDQTVAPGEFVIEGKNQDAATTILNFGSQRLVDRASLVRDTDRDLTGEFAVDPLNPNQYLVQYVVPAENVGVTHYFNIDPAENATVYGLAQGPIGTDHRAYSDMYDEEAGDVMYEEGRGGEAARPEVAADSSQVMYRTRSGSDFVELDFANDPFLPDIPGIYEFVISYPTATTLNSAVLEAYMSPAVTDGTTSLEIPSGRSGFHSDAPVLRFETTHLIWTGHTDPEAGYTADGTIPIDTILVTLNGTFTGDNRRQSVTDHLRDAFHNDDDDAGLWTTRTAAQSQSDTDAEVISRINGAYQLDLVNVEPGSSTVALTDFSVTRTKLGRYSWIVGAPTTAQKAMGFREGIYPRFRLVNTGSNMIRDATFLPRPGQDPIDITLDATNGTINQNGIATQIAEAIGAQDGWETLTKTSSNTGLVGTARIENGIVPAFDPLNVFIPQDIPAGRPADLWTIEVLNVGNTSAAPFIDDAVPDVTTQSQAGEFQVLNTPSYLFLQIRDSQVTQSTGIYEGESLFIVEAPFDMAAEDVAEDWILRIRRANPRLNITDGGVAGEFNIQPNNYSDLANFILVPTLNSGVQNIATCRRLLKDSIYYDGVDANRIELHPASAIPFINLPQVSLENGWEFFTQDDSVSGDLTNSAPIIMGDQQGVSLIFDSIRSWPRDEVNFNFEVPILAARQDIIGRDEINNTTISRPVNKILGADIGWTTPAFIYEATPTPDDVNGSVVTINGNDAPMNYESYVERTSLGLSPEFETEQLQSLALWADGSTVETFESPPAFNRLEVRSIGSDNPGTMVDLTNDGTLYRTNTYFVSEDYKLDLRTNGRFINLRISDNITDVSLFETTDDVNQHEYTKEEKEFRKDAEWRVSGMQLKVSKAGTR